jgi:hypothetical protein
LTNPTNVAVIARHNDLVIDTNSLDEELKYIKHESAAIRDNKLRTQKLSNIAKIIQNTDDEEETKGDDEIHVTSGCGIITLTQASEKSARGCNGAKTHNINGYSGYFGGQ